jgi:hypothetical protein
VLLEDKVQCCLTLDTTIVHKILQEQQHMAGDAHMQGKGLVCSDQAESRQRFLSCPV